MVNALGVEEEEKGEEETFVHFTKIGGSRLGWGIEVDFLLKNMTTYPHSWVRDCSKARGFRMSKRLLGVWPVWNDYFYETY
ncbi:hypothetical protein GCM10007390_07600 [Persicitalea jodogahamensis]|uniref:Uncharacterized protein n=1 Tax=Persicitalea jodogahamensis TaxID=402147 RepID=A0A8J3D1H8_9BACT|nr:hypothetical protein GCM10007390_07600 [Persicitalea jodogahamensis]